MKSRNNEDCFAFSKEISETADFLKKVRKYKEIVYILNLKFLVWKASHLKCVLVSVLQIK